MEIRLSGVFQTCDLESRNDCMYKEGIKNIEKVSSTHCSEESFLGTVEANMQMNGFTFVSRSEDITGSKFIAIAQSFGKPLVEDSAALKDFVDDSVILNIKEVFHSIASNLYHPFSRDVIFAHTENSASTLATRPKLLAFHCVQVEEDDSPTFLFSMKLIEKQLSSKTKHILQHTFYEDDSELPPLLRYEENKRPIFSFRDFFPAPLRWKCSVSGVSDTDVNNALSELTDTIYRTRCIATSWKKNDFLMFDNQQFFHAKPQSLSQSQELYRHIKRIRLG